MLLRKYVNIGEIIMERFVTEKQTDGLINDPAILAIKSLTSLRPKFDKILNKIKGNTIHGNKETANDNKGTRASQVFQQMNHK